jgi:hypothetical protein
MSAKILAFPPAVSDDDIAFHRLLIRQLEKCIAELELMDETYPDRDEEIAVNRELLCFFKSSSVQTCLAVVRGRERAP